jgi:hypothetical protein
MGKKTAAASAIFGSLLLMIGGVGMGYWLHQAGTSIVRLPTAPQTNTPKYGELAVPGKSPPATAPSSDEDAALVMQLSLNDPDIQRNVVQKLKALSVEDPRAMARGFPNWIDPLLATRQYKDVEQLSRAAILARPSETEVVQAAQRALVISLIAEEDYRDALPAAKSYYNVCPLSDTIEAVGFLAEILGKTRNAESAARFRNEQAVGSRAADGKVFPTAPPTIFSDSPPLESNLQMNTLTSIKVEADVYKDLISSLVSNQNAKGQHSYNRIARGNLLLLADEPGKALPVFIEACTLARGEKNIRDAIEGVARDMRAQDGSVARANVFITSLQQDPSTIGLSLTSHKKGAPTLQDFQDAAKRMVVAEIQFVPTLEQERQQNEAAAQAVTPATQIQITSDFECGTPVIAQQLSPTHVALSLSVSGYSGFCDWFMFRMTGVAGKTIRVDLTGDGILLDKWSTLNPVYCYADGLDNPDLFTSSAAPPLAKSEEAWNGPVLPATDGQQWHFISNVWREKADVFSFVQRFDSDSAYVAMRVPFTPRYNEQYLRRLSANQFVKVIEVGRSRENRPLLLAEIGSGLLTDEQNKPCVLVYAREHADEPDGSWVAQGIIEYLLKDGSHGASLRNQCTFLVIPLLDPDAASENMHEGMIATFFNGRASAESIAYANWFQAWADAGKRLDLVVDLHNVQSAESPNVACATVEGEDERLRMCVSLHSMILASMQHSSMSVTIRPWMRGIFSTRLGGWLSGNFGPLSLAYEINAQAPERHLTLDQLNGMGAAFCGAIGRFFASPDGTALRSNVDEQERARLARWKRIGKPMSPGDDAIASEAAAWSAGDGGNGGDNGNELIH